LDGFDRDGLKAAGTRRAATSQLENPLRVRLEDFIKMFVRIHAGILMPAALERHRHVIDLNLRTIIQHCGHALKAHRKLLIH